MNCLKCGTECDESAVFCSSCLEAMKQYPVKPGTPVLLPHRVELSAVKKASPRKKQPTIEEKLARSRRTTQFLGTLLAIVLLLLSFTVYFLHQALNTNTPPENIGQNYNTVAAEDR